MKKALASAMDKNILYTEAIALLKKLIATPSFSRQEENTAKVLAGCLHHYGIQVQQLQNNIWAKNLHFDVNKPTILLNSHHDTVQPNKAYTIDPFAPAYKYGMVFGLGSNDAGGPLVSLIATFLYYYNQPHLKYNLIIAASAEEEISGKNGIEALLKELPTINCAVVGEPTLLQMAVAERGLMVLDCAVQGKAGHAARDEGENAIYKALKDIQWIQSYSFERQSDLLGPVKMTVSSIDTENKTHNIIPSECTYIVDVRLNELYTHEEVFSTIQKNVGASISMRSDRLRSSMIPIEHPLVQAGLKLGKTYYGSPTSSDKSLMPFPALKIGPGDSARSHTADEFIFTKEIREGIDLYIDLLNTVLT